MTDEPELPLAGLDAERPLPAELRARLEAALLAAVAGGLPVPADEETLDAPRPLPEPLRARVESALLAEAAANPPAAVAGSTAEAAAAEAAPSATGGAQGPYRASGATGRAAGGPGQAAGGEGAVVSLESRRRKVVAWWSAVAAVLVLVLGAAGLVSVSGDGGSGKVEVAEAPTTTTAETPASVPPDAGSSADPLATTTAAGSPAADGPAATTTTARGARPVRPTPTTTRPAPAPGTNSEETGTPTPMGPPASSQPGGGSPQPAPMQPGGSTGSPPPFYDSTAPSGDASSPPAMTAGPGAASPAPSAGSSPQGSSPTENQKSGSPAAAAALRVGIIPGDAAQEAGFRAYIDRLNQSGGVRGYFVQLVNVGPGSPAPNTIATVNLGALPVAGPGGAPAWATGPLLETLTATEDLLRGSGAVFSFSSAPERQGHLAADALFPTKAAAGTKAVIYTAAAGPLRDAVPRAMHTVLQQRGVEVITVVEFDPARRPARFEAADAALLSLDPAAARVWLAEARSANHRPPAGVAGIYSLADETLLADLPEGARVVSPYVAPGGDEGQAIRSAGSTSASVLHGWATAKSLAAAIWRTGADTPAELQTALEGLTGWSSGLAPRYETRPGTRSRTPEGVLFRVQSKTFVGDGGFRRDPY